VCPYGQVLVHEARRHYAALRALVARLGSIGAAALYRRWGINPNGRRRKGHLVERLFAPSVNAIESAQLVLQLEAS